VERLRGNQGLDYEAGIERDRIGQKKLRFLDREDASRAGPAPTYGSHGALPAAVHIRRDANLDAEPLRGALEGRSFFLAYRNPATRSRAPANPGSRVSTSSATPR
jgi:hypothetical protein